MEASTMVIFGATGDLTRKKLFPALYELLVTEQISAPFSIIGFARRPWSRKHFQQRMKEAAVASHYDTHALDSYWDDIRPNLYYISGTFEDPRGFMLLKNKLLNLNARNNSGRNIVFYLATPPHYYPVIIENIGRAGLGHNPDGWTRIIVEKPFGHDLSSARDLNRRIESVFDESQIFRIDHYLGKETVQNLLVFRFANGIIEPLWNQRYIDHVQITVSEDIGVGDRGRYFEEAGIIRDMFQNHILQLLSLFAMEPPASFNPDAVRNEKVKVLQSIRPLTARDIQQKLVRGQYGHGLINDREVPGYREEKHVAADSIVETFVALKLCIDNWRWAGVPFYIRTGKRLPKRGTVITIIFRDVPHLLFLQANGTLEANVLSLRIQPEEGISLRFSSKVPGTKVNIRPVKMDFHYGTSFGRPIPDAYVRLLLDCLAGDSTLFTRKDEIEVAWTFTTAILAALREIPPPSFPNYESGSWGPSGSDLLIEQEGRRWRQI